MLDVRKMPDTRPTCDKCDKNKADIIENGTYFCGKCAVKRLNLLKKRKSYSSK